MRKLYILKTIVDFIWIMSWFGLPLIILLSIIMFVNNEPFDIPVQISGTTLDLSSAYDKYVLPVAILYLGILLYALFFFRKLLNNFRKRLIFEDENAKFLNKIGNLIIVSAIIYVLFDMFIHFISSKITIAIGYGPFLYLLGLGLFFKVLAEVFKMGKSMKDENELTI
jgi:hypothetical protein